MPPAMCSPNFHSERCKNRARDSTLRARPLPDLFPVRVGAPSPGEQKGELKMIQRKRRTHEVVGFPKEIDPEGECFIMIRSFDDDDDRAVSEAGGVKFITDPATQKVQQHADFPMAQLEAIFFRRVAMDQKGRTPKGKEFTGWIGFKDFPRPDGSNGPDLECTAQNLKLFTGHRGILMHIVMSGDLVDKKHEGKIKDSEKNWLLWPVGKPDGTGFSPSTGIAEAADTDGKASPSRLRQTGAKESK